MKKILSLMVAALSLLALSSCMKENFSNGADEATMTLNISMPDAVATKAYGDGMFAAKNVIIGVFDEKGVEKFRKNFVWEKDVFQQEVTIQFVMGKTYQMVLWAQYGDAYGDPKSMPLDEITLDYKQSNREDLDAFYAYVEPFRVTKDFSKSITLKRPFAQLNFATTVGDMDESIAAGDLGIHNKAQVTVKNLANTLDLFTGKTSYVAADGTETESGAAVIIPETEFPKVDGKYPTIKVEETVYEVVSMNYVLVADAGAQDGKTTVDLTLKVGELEINVPTASMKRNWRTNVVGELLTGEGTFTVKIDPIFDGTYNENWNEGTGSENENEKPQEPEQPEQPEQPEPIVPAVALTLVSTEAVPAEGGNVVVKVTSNVAWTLALDGTKVKEVAEAVTDFVVTVPVAANTTTEVVKHTLLLSDVPAQGAQAVTATAQFTQAAAQPEEPEVPEGPQVVTVAEFLAAKIDDSVWYKLTGTIISIDGPLYGNFTIKDQTGEVYVYGLTKTQVPSNDKSFASLGLGVNDVVTFIGTRSDYNGSAQVGGPAYYVSHIDNPDPEAPVLPENVASIPVDFSKVTNSTQYAEESHTFGDLTLNIVSCHINTQLRIYSSATNNGVVTSNKLPGAIHSIQMTAGNKNDNLIVYGSNDNGKTWDVVEKVAVVSSYKEYTVSFDGKNYDMFKLDVEGTNQLRISSMVVNHYK